jgi:hypothetical protein
MALGAGLTSALDPSGQGAQAFMTNFVGLKNKQNQKANGAANAAAVTAAVGPTPSWLSMSPTATNPNPAVNGGQPQPQPGATVAPGSPAPKGQPAAQQPVQPQAPQPPQAILQGIQSLSMPATDPTDGSILGGIASDEGVWGQGQDQPDLQALDAAIKTSKGYTDVAPFLPRAAAALRVYVSKAIPDAGNQKELAAARAFLNSYGQTLTP